MTERHCKGDLRDEPGFRKRLIPHPAEGEAISFGSWIDRLEVPLNRFIRGYVHDWQVAEDLAQETFLRVTRNLGAYRAQASLKTWVYSIARNLCLDYLRSVHRSRRRISGTVDVEEADQALHPSEQDPGSVVEAGEDRRRAAEALARISPRARTILILRIYQGLSYREIARNCRMGAGGVGTRISRALQELSEKLHN